MSLVQKYLRTGGGGNWFSAKDLAGPQDVQIAAITEEEVFNELQPVLSFVGGDKKLHLSATRLQAVVAMYGDNSDMWVGKWIRIDKEICQNPGKFYGQPMLVVRQPGQSAPPQQPPFQPSPQHQPQPQWAPQPMEPGDKF